MKKITLENQEYEVIEEYKDGFDKEALEERYTSYFEGYDYILGDFSYGKLRLKGFCEKENKLFNKINDYANIKEYIKDSCAYECKYFILKKIKNQ
jgi:uncharacterized protein YutD